MLMLMIVEWLTPYYGTVAQECLAKAVPVTSSPGHAGLLSGRK